MYNNSAIELFNVLKRIPVTFKYGVHDVEASICAGQFNSLITEYTDNRTTKIENKGKKS